MKILLVDDDATLLDLVGYALGRKGHRVVTAADGAQALALCRAERPDLVLLDVTLPEVDGFEVCRQIRQESPTPVILLTGRREDADVVRGLDVGADDYVTKPVSLRVLTARMNAVLRRYRQGDEGKGAAVVREGDLVLDPETHGVTKGNEPVLLTRTEFQVLYALARNAGRVVPTGRLVAYVWGSLDASRAASLRVHLAAIRRKVGLPAQGPGSIQNVRGTGYTLARSRPSRSSTTATPSASAC